MVATRASQSDAHHARRTVRLLLVALALFCTNGRAQTAQYRTLPRAVIDARIQEGPTQNQRREEELKKIFLESGCPRDELAEQEVDGTRLPNLICTLPGQTDSVIIVGGHYDMVDVGQGVVDNWSGASLLPSLYESLAAEPRQHTFVFVGFTSEEKGMVGSRFYAKELSKAEVARTCAMVNLDSLGLSSTKVEPYVSDAHLVSILLQVAAQMQLPVAGVDVSKVGTTDAGSFARRNIPVLSVHSVTPETFKVIHSRQDNLRSVQFSDYYDTYRLMAAFLAVLDGLPMPTRADR